LSAQVGPESTTHRSLRVLHVLLVLEFPFQAAHSGLRIKLLTVVAAPVILAARWILKRGGKIKTLVSVPVRGESNYEKSRPLRRGEAGAGIDCDIRGLLLVAFLKHLLSTGVRR
jgi:hypothetical protein